MSFRMRYVLVVFAVLLLSACGTTQHAVEPQSVEPHVMPQPHAIPSPGEPSSMSPDSDVRPSRYSMLFDTLEVPPLKVEAKNPPSEEFVTQLQQAVIQKLRRTQLFAHVVSEAEARERGGVLTLNARILFWEEHSEEGVIEIRLGIEDMGSSCEFTHATTKGGLKRTGAGGSTTGQYDIEPLLEGTVDFVNGFMHPNPYEL
jgi:hypothetical protein